MTTENCILFYSEQDANNALSRDSIFYKDLKSTLSTQYKVHEVQLIHSNIGELVRQTEQQCGEPIHAAYFWAHGKEGNLVCDTGIFSAHAAQNAFLSKIHTIWFSACKAGISHGVGRELSKRNVVVYAAELPVKHEVMFVVNDELAPMDLARPGSFTQLQDGIETPISLPSEKLEAQLLEKNEPYFLYCYYKTAKKMRKAIDFLLLGVLQGCERSLIELYKYKDHIPAGRGPTDLVNLLIARSQVSPNPKIDFVLGGHFLKMGEMEKAADAFAQAVAKGMPLALKHLKDLANTEGYALYKLAQIYAKNEKGEKAEKCVEKLWAMAHQLKETSPEKAFKLYSYCLNVTTPCRKAPNRSQDDSDLPRQTNGHTEIFKDMT